MFQALQAAKERTYKELKRFGANSEGYLYMAEYLVQNGHEREKVYEYSIKKIFYFFDLINKHNLKKLHDEAINYNTAIIGANSEDGHKEFKNYLKSLTE